MSKENKAETLGFQTEVKQLLHLVTHSLYSNKEIFLRELISNASDAADKLRFESISNPEFYENDSDLKIWIDFDSKEKTITVRDNAIGMSRNEVINNLGTIAKSGTRDFLASLTEAQSKDSALIGQFGVGFYSTFVVADKVTVKTRRVGAKKGAGVLWESNGEGEFTVSDIEKEDRGTEITLHLKSGEGELLDFWRLRTIITKYSDHIMLPIIMKKPLGENETKQEEEVVNKATALWATPKKDIADDEYKSFYKHISHDFEDPLLWTHNKVEGKLEYAMILYIPGHAPFDFWTRERKRGLKLYVQRVFILDDAEQLLPNYLRFVQGVVDSKDLPLNVSREILQNNRVIDQIRSSVIKRVLDMLENLAKNDSEKYDKFWKEFGGAIKEGLVEDHANAERIANLLQFASTKSDGAKQSIKLDDYINRMPKEQDEIYYITAENYNVAKNSPYLGVFNRNNIEVLLLDDRIDEWWLAHYKEHRGKKFKSITKSDVDIGKLTTEDSAEKKEESEKVKTEYEEMLKSMGEILKDSVAEVKLSERLTDSPVCIVTAENDLSFNMQKMMSAFGQNVPKTKPILEVNPKHELIKKVHGLKDKDLFADWTNLFYEQALLTAGGKLEDVALFTKRMNRLLLDV